MSIPQIHFTNARRSIFKTKLLVSRKLFLSGRSGVVFSGMTEIISIINCCVFQRKAPSPPMLLTFETVISYVISAGLFDSLMLPVVLTIADENNQCRIAFARKPRTLAAVETNCCYHNSGTRRERLKSALYLRLKSADLKYALNLFMKNSCFRTSASSLKRNIVRIYRQKFEYCAYLRILRGGTLKNWRTKSKMGL